MQTKIIGIITSVVVSVLLVAGIVLAVTTIGTNVTTTGSLTVGGDVAGPGANWAILPNGAFGLTLGGASMTALTVTTDSTGTAEVALPAGSIDSTEILDATIANADVNAAAAIVGTKIDPDFGAQNITTSGTIKSSGLTNIGWSVVASADTACEATCTNACVFGQDTGAADFKILDCDDAASDRCVCAGAN